MGRTAAILTAGLALLMGLFPAVSSSSENLVFGIHPGDGSVAKSLARVESDTGRTMAAVRAFYRWEDDYPGSKFGPVQAGGRSLIVSVKPKRADGSKISWRSIADAQPGSKLDSEMRDWARRVRDTGSATYVTFHHEPEASKNLAHGGAADYIAAWRKWVRVFRDEGASNVRFLWIMTDYSFAVKPTDRRYAPKWYPGDDFVDGMAVDAYNWFTCRSSSKKDNPWRPLEDIIRPFRDFGSDRPDKELWLAEWGSAEDPARPGRKAEWISEAKGLFAQPDYGQFAGISYFDRSGTGGAANCDWRIRSSASSVAAFADLATDPLFSGEVFDVDPDANQPPVAAFTTPTCDALTCAFDGTPSTDPDGQIVSYSWDFGDGSTGSSARVTHEFTEPGTYRITLLVEDDRGDTSSRTDTLLVSDGSSAPVELMGVATANKNTAGLTVAEPQGTAAGDVLVLFVTGNRSDTTITAPAGWTRLAAGTDQTMQSSVWWRVADGSGTSSTRITASAITKMDAQMVAYRGVDPADPIVAVAGAAETGTSASHSTPGVAGVPDGVEISYWSDKTSSTTSWTTPTSVRRISQSAGSGGGRITSVTADAPAVPTAVPLTAVASSSNSKALAWSVALRPG